jgi:uncharacterized protein
MQIYLPIAEMSVPAESLAILGIAVGFLSGVFGVGGGFLATPFLLFMGIPPAIAVGTQANQLIATSMTGVLGHWRKGNVDAHLGGVMAAGGMVGTIVGIGLFQVLQHFGQIDLFIAGGYVLLLGSIGVMMLVESIAAMMNRHKVTDIQPLSQREFFRNLPYKMRFNKSRLYVSALLPMGIGFVGGILVSILGIGGGFIIVPAMIYVLGMPTLLVAGTSLFQIIFISAFACVMHAVTSQTVDVMLALIMMAGGVIGAQVGVRVAKHLKGASARIALAVIIIGVCVRMLMELFMQPSDIFKLDMMP